MWYNELQIHTVLTGSLVHGLYLFRRSYVSAILKSSIESAIPVYTSSFTEGWSVRQTVDVDKVRPEGKERREKMNTAVCRKGGKHDLASWYSSWMEFWGKAGFWRDSFRVWMVRKRWGLATGSVELELEGRMRKEDIKIYCKKCMCVQTL
jgi:hypothetical protein